jgi:hypothetical protein
LAYKVNAITTTATSAAVSINNSIKAKTITTGVTACREKMALYTAVLKAALVKVFKKQPQHWQGNSVILPAARATTTAALARQQRHLAHSDGHNNSGIGKATASPHTYCKHLLF